MSKAARKTPAPVVVAPPTGIGVGKFKITPKALQYVTEALMSERLSYGPFLKEFERVFAAAHDCRFGLMTNSGTSSLMIAVAALKEKYGWADGDEVIVPAVTFVATANVVIQLNLKPVFVDVDPIFYSLDPEKVEKAITPRTRCMIPVHLFGLPADMQRLMPIAEKHKLRVIEDSCETMFTRCAGTSVGSFGDVGCFSTYMAHILVTGVGGLCTTNDPSLAITLRSLANHGRDSIYLSIDDDDGKSADEMKMIIQKRFSFVQLGYSFRVTEMEGALGLAEFERRDEMMRKRRANGAYFNEKLRSLSDRLQLPAIRPESEHAFMVYPVVLRNEPKRAFVEYLEGRGIETRDMVPLVNQPVYKKLLGTRESDYPVAEWINKNGLYFASHQELSDTDREFIVDSIHDYFAKRTSPRERRSLVVMANVPDPVEPRAVANVVESMPVSLFDELLIATPNDNTLVAQSFKAAGFSVVTGYRSKSDLLRAALTKASGHHVVVMGADGADDPDAIVSLLHGLEKGNDLVVASRFAPGGERRNSRPLSFHSIGNRLFSFLAGLLFRANVTDANNGFRALRRDALLAANTMTSFAMTVDGLQQGLKYHEVSTKERPSVLAHRRSNRFLSAISFLWILTRAALRPRRREHTR